MKALIEQLLNSGEPSIVLKVRTRVLGEAEGALPIRRLRDRIRESRRVRALLGGRAEDGRLQPVRNVYQKWTGAHWVFASLADIGYPAGDETLLPICDQVLDGWLGPEYSREHVCATVRARDRGVPIVNGRARRCASQQSNALYAALTLGFVDERCERLANLLMRWQWPDGGWNCDRRPEARTSSFWESHLPLRALALYAKRTGDKKARVAAGRAAEVFLGRLLFRRLRDGQPMNPQFLRLHYPCYWRYDILHGLKVMAETGFIRDARCKDALDILEAKQLPGGGWSADERFYTTGASARSGRDKVDWGPVGRDRMNEWVTADALYVLAAAGRLTPNVASRRTPPAR